MSRIDESSRAHIHRVREGAFDVATGVFYTAVIVAGVVALALLVVATLYEAGVAARILR